MFVLAAVQNEHTIMSLYSIDGGNINTVHVRHHVDTLKDVFKNVASRNIIAYIKDIGFYNCI